MTERIAIKTTTSRRLSDLTTPVGLYLKLRNEFPNSLLLESSDYRGTDNSFSYVCVDPIASITLTNGTLTEVSSDGSQSQSPLRGRHAATRALEGFIKRFEVSTDAPAIPGVINGIFGFLSYDAISAIEDLALTSATLPGEAIPQLHYALYRFVIAINHFKNELHIVENIVANDGRSRLPLLLSLLAKEPPSPGHFHRKGPERSNLTDAEHNALISTCQSHIRRGDVFQIVPSRKFTQAYEGDDFQVYRALRSLNPSPYLFYFDCGDFHIFGSSPEAELVVKGRTASLFPIAGTYRRTGNDEVDAKSAQALLDDPKESAEHVMLVDLARNDLSIHCHPVQVEKFKEIQFYSHVIHLVSKVSGALAPSTSSVAVLASTFPAGTLTGAPKFKAMELLDRHEPGRRTFYGGALGFIGFDGNVNHAIIIRSFLSKDGELHTQGGSGVVADSVPEREVAEVSNKLGALRAALAMAEEL